MMISDEHRFVFVHIYKTGGSSLTKLVAGLVEPTHRQAEPRTSGPGWQETWHLEGGQHWKMGHLRTRPGWADRDLSDYLLITFVRNPYSWILSVWNDFYRHRANPGAGHFERLYPDCTFGSFCRFVDACSGGLNPGLWGMTTQGSFIDDVDGIAPRRRFVGRLERFEADIHALSERLGLATGEVPHEVRHDNGDRGSWIDHYTDESLEIVNRVFASDFERFGYEQVFVTNPTTAARRAA